MSNNKPGFRGGRDPGALTENVELLTGQRGSGLDRAITLRDLADLGLARLRRFGQGAAGGVKPELNPDLIPGGDAQRPGKPQNLMASGAFHNIILAWDEPTYRGHSHTEIWRAPADNLAAAELVGTTNANLYADAVGGALKAWYWVRFVNVNDIEGPYSGPGGKYAETSRDIDDILEEMAGKISESELTAALRETIGDLDALWTAKAGVGEIVAGIGLLARPDGTTEAAVSAGRFSVFDPAKPLSKTNIFVVEGGKVYMNTAFIKQAYIEQVVAEVVTADLINTLNLNAVNISGGQIQIGTRFSVDSAGNLVASNMNAHNTTLTGTLTVPHASIGTLNLAGNAVTIPVSSYSAASYDNWDSAPAGGWRSLQSLGVTSTGAPAQITCCAEIEKRNAGELYYKARILRDGVVIWQITSYNGIYVAGHFSNIFSVTISDTPPAGWHVYELQIMRSYPSYNESSARNRGIYYMETKR